jgi:hypothetical protein
MSLIGLDLNATRARALAGPLACVPVPLALEGGQRNLPLALSLRERHVIVGQAGNAFCRESPHLVCRDFLAHLGSSRQWTAGRHCFDAGRALTAVFDHLNQRFGHAEGIVAVLPDYLTLPQITLLTQLAGKARWRLLGSCPASVAAVLALQAELPFPGIVLVLDVDGTALTCSAVRSVGDQVQLLTSQSAPRLAWGAWLNRMIDAVANRCVRLTRRDPRESPAADQALYDQIAALLEMPETSPFLQLALRTEHWSQHLMLQAGELAGFCAPLVAQSLALFHAVEQLVRAPAARVSGPLAGVAVTSMARTLPGLVPALEQAVRSWASQSDEPTLEERGAFGFDLLLSEQTAPSVHLLDPDSLARTAHEVGLRIVKGEISPGHHEALPVAVSGGVIDPGPPRLHFRGRDHLLTTDVFTIGRDPECSLVFEAQLYPTVAPRHCDVIFDRGAMAGRRAYAVLDRSHSTLINDRPVRQHEALHSGDRIRLGPLGPVLQFLGGA